MYEIELKLKEKRTLAKISQANLAKKCNMTQSYISRIERQLKAPTLKSLENLSNALNIHPCDLLKINKIL
ncbi:helix-turn-helix transcriptional regulator [Clostridium botulinum D/C]|uniref:helix-turn-helix domain-containing protein n=1 Tax=Clostridium botulinum TaxID=1491 RepID=UPI001E30663C|nr:helix-turn-helix transcriptional regulator [Clostridium botulinum]MCD3351240.1 helix-turn-helix transcriptional regulator [Clostridium botulinum D/C]MCD3360197.1 helix-turn-helix transcriptional regulator [Clostridium botulinum D/C]MCD3361700.1 helix-turn-helix transcriptional regulator [Clostridium botulinum D/C]MCD3366002.1 helix-turn-helix transcriptional regulator [Clostridium botulinum D/C]